MKFTENKSESPFAASENQRHASNNGDNCI